MRPDDADKFAGVDDFGFLPELWEMALIAGDQVVRAGGIGAFEENVIGGVGRGFEGAGGGGGKGAGFVGVEELLPEALSDMEFRLREGGGVLRGDRGRHGE